ncbi:hypothetical protein ABG768_010692, partial [Culter alburnus]
MRYIHGIAVQQLQPPSLTSATVLLMRPAYQFVDHLEQHHAFAIIREKLVPLMALGLVIPWRMNSQWTVTQVPK